MITPEQIEKIVKQVLDSDVPEFNEPTNFEKELETLCGQVVQATESFLLAQIEGEDKLVEIDYLLDQLEFNYNYSMRLKNSIDEHHWSRHLTKYDGEKISTLSQDLINIANGLFELREKCKGLSLHLLARDNKVREEEKKRYQQHMQGFPSFQYPISEYCLCEKWECQYYQKYEDNQRQKTENGVIGWCKRFTPDPDAGYIHSCLLPPCVVWAVKREALTPEKKSSPSVKE